MIDRKISSLGPLMAGAFAWALLINVAVLVLGVNQASAMVIYTDRAEWETAVAGTLTTDVFANGIANADTITFDSGVTSTRNSTNANFVNGTGGIYVGQVQPSATLSWVFPWQVSAFGFDVVSIAGGTNIIGNFDGSGEQTINIGTALPGTYYNGFLGILGTGDFNSILFTGSMTDTFTVDNLSFNRSAQVPEPGSFILLGIGLIYIAYRRRIKVKADLRSIPFMQQ